MDSAVWWHTRASGGRSSSLSEGRPSCHWLSQSTSAALNPNRAYSTQLTIVIFFSAFEILPTSVAHWRIDSREVCTVYGNPRSKQLREWIASVSQLLLVTDFPGKKGAALRGRMRKNAGIHRRYHDTSITQSLSEIISPDNVTYRIVFARSKHSRPRGTECRLPGKVPSSTNGLTACLPT